MRALANTTLSEPISSRFGNRLSGRASTGHCFSTLHTNYWWPHQANGDKSEDGDPRPDADVTENVWNRAFELRQSSRKPSLQRRIHVFGVDAIGLLVAHSLAGIPNRPPITFLTGTRDGLHRPRESERLIEVVTDGISDVRSGFDIEYDHPYIETEPLYSSVGSSDPQNFDRVDTAGRFRLADELNAVRATSDPELVLPVEKSLVGEQTDAADTAFDASRDVMRNEAVLPDAEQGKEYSSSSSDDQDFISNLIVSVPVIHLRCLSKIAHRLSKESVLLFLQNEMGFIELLNEEVFPDPQTRPTYIVGVASHVAARTKAYTVVHSGRGAIALGVLPGGGPGPIHSLSTSARYLLRTITRTPVLAAVAYDPINILQYRLERLAIDCVIHPLTAVIECRNGELLCNFHIARMMKLVLAEISLVIRSLPELQNVPGLQNRFDPGRLEFYVVSVARRTSQDQSQMLQDIRAGRSTHIKFLNGYFIRKGEELGIRCVMNYMVKQMVQAKQRSVSNNDLERLPIESQDGLILAGR